MIVSTRRRFDPEVSHGLIAGLLGVLVALFGFVALGVVNVVVVGLLVRYLCGPGVVAAWAGWLAALAVALTVLEVLTLLVSVGKPKPRPRVGQDAQTQGTEQVERRQPKEQPEPK